MTDISKTTIVKSCRGEVVEKLVEEFGKCADRSNATGLEVLVAATTFTAIVGEAVHDPKLRTAMMSALVETNLQ